MVLKTMATFTATVVLLGLSSVAFGQRGAAPPTMGGPAGGPSSYGSPYGGPGRSAMMRSPVPVQPGYPTRFSSVPPSSRSAGPSQFQAVPPAASRSSRPTEPVPPDTSGIQRALGERNFEQVGQEAQGVRSRTDGLRTLDSELPKQDLLKAPLLDYKYRRGADIIEQGSSAKDEYKVRMGIQQINEANEKLGRELQRGRQHGGEQPGRGQGNKDH